MHRALAMMTCLLMVSACGGDGCTRSTVGHPTAPAGPTLVPAEAEAGFLATAERLVERIGTLETESDVTCWTSFRQLDGFIATRMYSEHGQLLKIAAIKKLLRAIWYEASLRAVGSEVTAPDLDAVVQLSTGGLNEEQRARLDRHGPGLGLQSFDDYRSTSEHWRLLLSIVFDELRAPRGLRPLNPASEERLAMIATGLSLQLLERSGAQAALAHTLHIEAPAVQRAYQELRTVHDLMEEPPASDLPSTPSLEVERALGVLTGNLIAAKVNALRAYNLPGDDMSTELGRAAEGRLEAGSYEALMFMLEHFLGPLLDGTDLPHRDNFINLTSRHGRAGTAPYVDLLRATNMLNQLIPHRLLSNGDVVLRVVSNPGVAMSIHTDTEVVLVDYQMNAVRDTAIHWLALQQAHEQLPFAMDPFAAEIVSEMLSVLVTFSLRIGPHLYSAEPDPPVTPLALRHLSNASHVFVPPGEPPGLTWTEEELAPEEVARSAAPAPRFEDVTRTWGLDSQLRRSNVLSPWQSAGTSENESNEQPARYARRFARIAGFGNAVGDINGDGYPDLVMAGPEQLRMYLNGGPANPGVLRDATSAWGLPDGVLYDAHHPLLFDLEGDGDTDLLVVRGYDTLMLFEQREAGSFVEVAVERGLQTARGPLHASIFDADQDGDLDIFLGYYGQDACNRPEAYPAESRCVRVDAPSLDGRNGSPNQLWLQQDGLFVEAAADAGLDDVGWSMASVAFDADRDGVSDLYVANDFGRNRFYRGLGEGRFREEAAAAGLDDRGAGMGTSLVDIEGDGDMDIYVSNIDMFSKSIKVVFPQGSSTVEIDDGLLSSMQYLSGNKLFRNDLDTGSGPAFQVVNGAFFEPGDRGWTWGAAFFDYENDGDLDMYLANGFLQDTSPDGQRNQMFLREEGRWFQIEDHSPELLAVNARSVIPVDLDRDGDLDLVVSTMTETRLLENVHPDPGHWVGIRLESPGANSRAIGAHVEVRTPAGVQHRQVTLGEGFLSQGEEILHFGLGSSETAEVLVYWPNGGQTGPVEVETGRINVVRKPAGGP